MDGIFKYDLIKHLIVELRGEKVIVDCDIIELFGVEAKVLKNLLKKNMEKFPEGYVIETTKNEKEGLIGSSNRFHLLKYSTSCPKAFTMKGFYMLATLLKSEMATQIALDMVDTFARIQDLAQIMKKISGVNDNSDKKMLMKTSSEILTELFDGDMLRKGSESGMELNFTLLSFKHKVQIDEM